VPPASSSTPRTDQLRERRAGHPTLFRLTTKLQDGVIPKGSQEDARCPHNQRSDISSIRPFPKMLVQEQKLYITPGWIRSMI
jgi:hypothetical protein